MLIELYNIHDRMKRLCIWFSWVQKAYRRVIYFYLSYDKPCGIGGGSGIMNHESWL